MNETLEKILNQLMTLNGTVARQEAVLDEHIRRTEVAEVNISQIAESIRPIQEHVAMVRGGVKLLAALGAIIALLISLANYFKP